MGRSAPRQITTRTLSNLDRQYVVDVGMGPPTHRIPLPLDDTPRPLHYFEATNDYLQSVPESPFTGAPAVTLSTETGYRKLSGDPFVEIDGADRCERTVTDDAWHDLLEQKFGLRYRSG